MTPFGEICYAGSADARAMRPHGQGSRAVRELRERLTNSAG